MATKTISTYVAAGYTLATKYSGLLITSTGGVGGTGVTCPVYASITNAGKVSADATHDGIHLEADGTVLNQRSGFIGGYAGVFVTGATASITNYGTIEGSGYYAVRLEGGSVTNGSDSDVNALIAGREIAFGAGTLSNFGTITADIIMAEGGQATNGSLADTQALINHPGGVDIFGGQGTVSNFGSINGGYSYGINLGSGGLVTNGAAGDTFAQIYGKDAAVQMYGQGTVSNFGILIGHISGVSLGYGGSFTNGSAVDRTALAEGYFGARIRSHSGTVINFGTIDGVGLSSFEKGLSLEAGGLVTNGSGADRTALIEGYIGVEIDGGGHARNLGTILGTGKVASGVSLDTGTVTNGSTKNARALIKGYTGVDLRGAASVTNFGTIRGTGDKGGAALLLEAGGALVNGDADHTKATIEGYVGVTANGSATKVTNFGTMIGAGGTALRFGHAGDTLVVEAGSTFMGAVYGGGGILNLASGTGTLTGLLSPGGDVTVSGSMATTTFQNFSKVVVGPNASFVDKGAVSVAAGQTIIASGTLSLGGKGQSGIVNAGLIETLGSGALTVVGPLANTGTIEAAGGMMTIEVALSSAGVLVAYGGTLAVDRAVTGSGVARINGGTLAFGSTFTQNVAFTGATGILELAQSQGYTGTIAGFSQSGETALNLADIGFASSKEAIYSGTSTGGVLTVTDGSHTAEIHLTGNYLSATFVASGDGHGGTTVVATTPGGAKPPHALIAAIAALGALPVHAIHPDEAWSVREPMLAGPRLKSA